MADEQSNADNLRERTVSYLSFPFVYSDMQERSHLTRLTGRMGKRVRPW